MLTILLIRRGNRGRGTFGTPMVRLDVSHLGAIADTGPISPEEASERVFYVPQSYPIEPPPCQGDLWR